jgi:hypothetical protein
MSFSYRIGKNNATLTFRQRCYDGRKNEEEAGFDGRRSLRAVSGTNSIL